jgi:hypothetical protein
MQAEERSTRKTGKLTPNSHHRRDEDENEDLPEAPIHIVRDLEEDDLAGSKGVEILERRRCDLYPSEASSDATPWKSRPDEREGRGANDP